MTRIPYTAVEMTHVHFAYCLVSVSPEFTERESPCRRYRQHPAAQRRKRRCGRGDAKPGSYQAG